MSARVYTLSAANQTVLGATTLLSLRPGTTCALEILRMWCGQSANATSNQQRIQVGSQAAAFGTVVSTTPQKTWEGDPISQIVGGAAQAAGTSGVNASAEAAGAKTTRFEEAFNVLNGWLWQPTPRDTIVLSPGSAGAFYVFFPIAPTSLTGWTFGLTFAEIG